MAVLVYSLSGQNTCAVLFLHVHKGASFPLQATLAGRGKCWEKDQASRWSRSFVIPLFNTDLSIMFDYWRCREMKFVICSCDVLFVHACEKFGRTVPKTADQALSHPLHVPRCSHSAGCTPATAALLLHSEPRWKPHPTLRNPSRRVSTGGW